MVRILAKVLIVALALLAAGRLVPGVHLADIYSALIASVVLGLINLFVRPVLRLLTLPITILTFGLFALVLNALLFWLAATFVRGFSVDGFLAAFLGALFISVVHVVMDRALE
jgi:putative membrane protein